jgi:general stress protein 26
MANDRTDSTRPSGAGDREKLHELLESFSTVMLITHALPGDGQNAAPGTAGRDVEVTSRPMQVARLDENCDLWFLTDKDTAKVYEIREEPVVHVVAQDERDRFISLRGTARVLQDQATIHELWSEPYKTWFPDGPETPGIRAIHFAAHEGEYWDNKGVNKIKYIFEAARAYVSGDRPKVDQGEQFGRVQL